VSYGTTKLCAVVKFSSEEIYCMRRGLTWHPLSERYAIVPAAVVAWWVDIAHTRGCQVEILK